MAWALLPLTRQAVGQLARFRQATGSCGGGAEPLPHIPFEELAMPNRLNDMLAAFAERSNGQSFIDWIFALENLYS